MKSFFGVNVYEQFSRRWIAANVLFGLATIVVGLWICKRYADRISGSPLMNRLMRDIAGQNLYEAVAFVQSLSHSDAGRHG